MPAIIRINLETGSVSRREQEKDDLLLGGRRLTGSIIAAEVPPECEPLSGRNKLVLACGPLAGTLVSSANRLSIGAKSPLTGGIKESNAGGMTGYLMGRLGIRAVVLEGRPGAPHWTLIRISADGVELLPGDPYVGLGLFEKARQLFERFGPKVGMTLIGRAGERLQFSAGITNTDPDGEPSRYNGRGGLGAVMGSKGVQGIVYDASAAPKETFVDRAAFMEANREVARRINANPQTSQVYRQYGTAAMMDATSAMGALPTRNFSTGFFEGYEKINAEAMHRTILERGGEGATSHACMVGCLVKCSNIFPDRDGKKVCSPIEYENLGLLGSNLGIDDLDTIALLNRMCNDFGYDTIETGAAIGVAMNAGLAAFGDREAALRLMREVGEGTPLGRVLGSGAGITGKVFGCLRVPVAKNQAMPAYDPRAIKGVGVTYAVSPQGADHTSGNTVKSPVKQHLKDGQETVSRNAQVGFTVMDNLGLCILASGGIGDLGVVADLLKARWGVETTPERLRREAWETVLLERGFNRRAGLTPAHDRLPEFFEEEINPANGQVFDVPEDTLRRVYDEPPA
ncbi:MAG TPA: aldehyde ferredoxin oxidoreductase [Bilophila wadsworthia]|uniref:aldehyde ferredoxin oxidoreductase C-terminal domain-containing protein n=1 Tax=Bilophila wadsworthia TaxID=35833 RepID=UPI001D32553F|nr:aldehyde ferredoxin oxidoreductase C-terminal domain-containing protein [Bilophila wadsworthia]HJH15160.1 aldehyde ferredoxin oxidoreductase [Bilophila wadsworthia]